MVFPIDYVLNLSLVADALRKPKLLRGAVVECGTWRGGMAAGLMKVGGTTRKYYFFDSFKGLPPPEEIDGPEALAWANDPTGPRYFNNCRAETSEFISVMSRAGFSAEQYDVVQGYYLDSMPGLEVTPISVLRLDSDWYSSTMTCLEHLWPHVLPGGLIILDDYYHWQGCRKALHAYLATLQRSEAVRASRYGSFAYLWKAE